MELKPRDLESWCAKLDAATVALIKQRKALIKQRKVANRCLAEWLWWVERIWAELDSRDTVDRKLLMEIRLEIDAAVPGWKKLREKLEGKKS